jgi:PAB-dependent poly(A)-specific ribonuclease subunit 2
LPCPIADFIRHPRVLAVTLKSAYIRLRALVDQGVVFVGHGLKKDFQMVNLVVPPAQIHDTVELYQLPGQRFLSLKFLATNVLGARIQVYCWMAFRNCHQL